MGGLKEETEDFSRAEDEDINGEDETERRSDDARSISENRFGLIQGTGSNRTNLFSSQVCLLQKLDQFFSLPPSTRRSPPRPSAVAHRSPLGANQQIYKYAGTLPASYGLTSTLFLLCGCQMESVKA
ncbi:hypothetical protein SAY87_008687 [Trapa incisa]|uniref:Uncharacterized protein n=1 Tax=Trapa incisa TaxID=236973 RepID=A0AAN7JYL7_9MYRT|nr:hypothetical protein SAY87_008687 [Trapa incisa]